MANTSRTQNSQCGPAATAEHPAWCSPQHCYRTDDGVRVHVQAPVCWEDDDPLVPVRCESRLLDPADDDDVYLELDLKCVPLRGNGFSWIVSLDTVADKAAWGDGPWVDEPDKAQWVDEATGFTCLALRHRRENWRGYVGVPSTHPLHNVQFGDVDLDVHDTVTYSDFCDDSDDLPIREPNLPRTESRRARRYVVVRL